MADTITTPEQTQSKDAPETDALHLLVRKLDKLETTRPRSPAWG